MVKPLATAPSAHSLFGSQSQQTFYPSGAPGDLNLVLAQLGFRVERLEQEATLTQERLNSITRVC